MSDISTVAVYVIGFFFVFGGISWLWGKVEDWWTDSQSTPKIGLPTSKVVKVAGRVLKEIKEVGGKETIYIEE